MSPSSKALLDEAEISSLLRRERFYRDTGRWTEFRECWHPDSSKTLVDLTWYKGDIDPFVAHSRKLFNRKVISTHLIQPSAIHINGHKAYAESPCVIMSRFEYKDSEYDLNSWIHLVSQLEKVATDQSGDAEWKMLSLEVIYLRDSMTPVPGSPELDFEGINQWPRSSYRFAAWHLLQRGLEVRKDLPGWDDEASCEEVARRNFRWLNA